MAIFEKIGHLGIKTILNDKNIAYSKDLIIMASDLKSKLEGMNIKKGKFSIISFDAIKMYPSITLGMVKKKQSSTSQAKLC